MTQKQFFRTLAAAMLLSLLSVPAMAQLTLGAKGSADTKKGAKGDTTAKTDAPAAEPAPAEPVAAEPAPAAEPVATEPAAMEPVATEPMMVDAAPVADEAKPGGDGVAGWDGGFYIKTPDDNFKLKINGILKTRFGLLNDEVAVIGDNGEPGTNHVVHSAFSVPYFRFQMSGNLFTPRLTYTTIYDFATTTLIEGWADWAFIKDKLQLTVGVMKRPYSRDYINSSAANNMIFGSVGEFGHGADTGVMLSNNYRKVKGLEWAVGVFNRSVDSPGSNYDAVGTANNKYVRFNDFAPAIVGRIGFNNDKTGYLASDFDGGPVRFGVALSAAMEFDHDADNQSNHYLSLDGILKVHGLAISAAGYMENVAGDGADGGAGFWDEPNLNRIGTFVKAAYLIKKRFEPVARYGMVHSYQANEDIQEEITAGLNVYFFGQNFKWENNISLLTQRLGPNADPAALQDILFTSQMQFMF